MTPELEVLSLAKRVQKLERTNRWWRVATAFLLLFILFSLQKTLMSQEGAQTEAHALRANSVEAKAFRLVDDRGGARAWLGMRANGPTLELYDGAGHLTWSTASKPHIVR